MFKGKVKRYLDSDLLTKNDRKIGNFIIKNYSEQLSLLSIKELAYKSGVSVSAISRFFTKMNVAGYKGFINTIISEQHENNFDLYSNEIQSILKTKQLIMSENLKNIAKLIHRHKKVKLYSSGFSLYIVNNFKRQLNKINIKTTIENIYDVANIFPSNEIHLFVSFSGQNSNFIKVINKLSSFDEKLIMFSITSTSHSTIKKYVSDHIHGSVYSDGKIVDEKELPTISSRVMHYILDKLFEEVYMLDQEKHNKLIENIK